ncbi:hypothetical protein TGRUB_270810 [Toxoplasma gondii RUB]|uniref:Uncharacterized protein n=1 Tax=Toxoplasma gondii RUB TaxID=935652 RepID=A0A086LYC6_TOXGO|nr:hypothetical protein TGRUB_270810 [Toxoplasma gondii RUB]
MSAGVRVGITQIEQTAPFVFPLDKTQSSGALLTMQASSGVRLSPPPVGPASGVGSCSSFSSCSPLPRVPMHARDGSPYRSRVHSFSKPFLPSVSPRIALNVPASAAQPSDRYRLPDAASSPHVLLSVPQSVVFPGVSNSQPGLCLPTLSLSAASPVARSGVSPPVGASAETIARAGSLASTPHTLPTTVSSVPPVTAAGGSTASASVSPAFLPSLPVSLAFARPPAPVAPSAVGGVSSRPVPGRGDISGAAGPERGDQSRERQRPSRVFQEQEEGASSFLEETHPLRKAWLGWRCLCYAEPPPGTTAFERASVNEEISHMVGFGRETALLSDSDASTEGAEEEETAGEERQTDLGDVDRRKRARTEREGAQEAEAKRPKRRRKRDLWAVRTGGERLGRDLLLTQQTGGPFEKEILEFLGQQHAARNHAFDRILEELETERACYERDRSCSGVQTLGAATNRGAAEVARLELSLTDVDQDFVSAAVNSLPSIRCFAESLRLDDLESSLQTRLAACEARKCRLKALCEKARKERALVRQEREELKNKERELESMSEEQAREAPSHRTSI